MNDSSTVPSDGVTRLPDNRFRRRRWRRVVLIALPLLIGLYALAGFVVVPWAVQRWGVPMASEYFNGDLSVGTLRLNPFTLSATLEDVAVTDLDGKKVLGLGRFYGNLQASSLVREGIVVRRVELDAPFVHAELRADGSLNLATLFKPSDTPSTEPIVLPRVRGEGLAVRDGRIEYVDRIFTQAPDRVIEPLTFEIDAFDSAPLHANLHRMTAETNAAEQLTWEGQVILAPFQASGRIEVHAFNLQEYHPYVSGIVPVAISSGKLWSNVTYRIAPTAEPNIAEVVVEDVRIEGLDVTLAEEPIFHADRIELADLRADAVARSVRLARVSAEGPGVTVVRTTDGTVLIAKAITDIMDYFGVGLDTSGGTAPPVEVGGPEKLGLPEPLEGIVVSLITLSREAVGAWTIDVESVEVADGSAAWRDAAMTPAVDFAVNAAQVKAGPIRSSEDYATAFDVSLTPGDSGSVSAKGTIEPLAPRAALNLEAEGVNLTPLAPYVAAASPMLTLNRGVFGARGDVRVALTEAAGPDAAALPVVATDQFSVTGNLDARITDVDPPVEAAVHAISIQIDGLDTATQTPGNLKFSARLNDAELSVAGTALPDLAVPLNSRVDLTVTLREFGLPAMTGYSERYVGRVLSSGRLTIDEPLTVTLVDQKLDARVPVRVDDFNFGDKVESDQATSLPVGMAVAILKGPSGTIKPPALKVSGDLSDPSVSVAGLVLHAVTNLITGIATSPFNMLAGVVSGGGSDDPGAPAPDLSFVTFGPGEAALRPDALSKLDLIGEALRQRPELRFGLVAPAVLAPADLRVLSHDALIHTLRQRTAATFPPNDPRRVNPESITVTDVQYRRAVVAAYGGDPTTLTAEPVAAAEDETPVASSEPTVQPDEDTASRATPRRRMRGGRAVRTTRRETVNEEPLLNDVFGIGGPTRSETDGPPAAPPVPEAGSQPGTPAGSAAPTFEQMENEVLLKVTVPPDAIAALNRRRFQAIVAYLAGPAALDPSRLIVPDAAVAAPPAPDAAAPSPTPPPTPRINFELDV